MEESSIDWCSLVTKLLKEDKTQEVVELNDSLKALEKDDVHKAIKCLNSLNHIQYIFCIFILEMKWVEQNGSYEDLKHFSEAIRQKISDVKGITDLLSPNLLKKWSQQVAVYLSVDDILFRAKMFRGEYILGIVISTLCFQNKHSQAIPIAENYDIYHRASCAQYWADILLGLSEGKPRDDVIIKLASIGAERPMIRKGGEECEAYAYAINAFSSLNLSVASKPVLKVINGLKRLAKTANSERFYGIYLACFFAAKNAGQNKSEDWLAFALELKETIWDSVYKKYAALVIDFARSHFEGNDDSFVKSLIEEFNVDTSNSHSDYHAVVRFLEQGRIVKRDDKDLLRERYLAGEDVEDEISALISGICKRYSHPLSSGQRAGEIFSLGCNLDLSDERLQELLEQYEFPDARWKAEAIYRGCFSFWFRKQNDRLRVWINKAYPNGDEYGSSLEKYAPFLTEEILLATERYYIANEKPKALCALISNWLDKGEYKHASRILYYIGKSTSSKPWKPTYLVNEPLFSTIAEKEAIRVVPQASEKSDLVIAPKDLKQQLKATNCRKTLLEFVHKYHHIEACKPILLATLKLKKHRKKVCDRILILRALLLLDDFDDALSLLTTVIDKESPEDFSRGRKSARLLIDYLFLHPHLVTSDVINTLADDLYNCFWQWVWKERYLLGRLCYKLPDNEDSEFVISRMLEKAPHHMPARHVPFLGCITGAFERFGNQAEVFPDWQEHLKLIPELIASKSTYAAGWDLEKCAYFRKLLPENVWQDFYWQVLLAVFSDHNKVLNINNLKVLEEANRHLWSVGDWSIMLKVFEHETLSDVVKEKLFRTIWYDIEYAPNQFKVLKDTQPLSGATKSVRKEYCCAVSKVLMMNEHEDALAVKDLISDS